MNNLEEILENCLAELQEGKSLDNVLAAYPDQADELRPLLEIAKTLTELPDPGISVHAMMETMAKLSIDGHQIEAKKIHFFSKPILLRVAASVIILFFAGFGTVASSRNALPGELMYPVKLFTEKVRFFMTTNPENKVELRIVFSEERMKEFVKKYNNGEGADRKLLLAMIDEAKLALKKGKALPGKEKKLYVSRVANMTHLQAKTLKDLESNASPEDKAILSECADACFKICGCDQRERCCESLEKHLKNCPCNILKD